MLLIGAYPLQISEIIMNFVSLYVAVLNSLGVYTLNQNIYMRRIRRLHVKNVDFLKSVEYAKSLNITRL